MASRTNWERLWYHIPAGYPLCFTILLAGELVLALPRGEDTVQELPGPTELEWMESILQSRPR